uniref:Hedgehog protein Hint domain-containing protein n=1 Tax=Rhodosorus marinus TaxID=101924 RepID=A0A7S0G070_9RHOD|mmetsp:Transcript_10759/g.15532  ORF Transcript_10759/g.15532 Transcript_10759/m.15532 type:complete len:699 (+) Transcript_10759:306-2402(+)
MHGWRFLQFLLVGLCICLGRGSPIDYRKISLDIPERQAEMQTSVESFAIKVPNIFDRITPYSISLDKDHVLAGVKYEESAGGGRAMLYKKVGERDWEEVLRVSHPESFKDFGDSVNLDVEKGWIFVGLERHLPSLETPRRECGGSFDKCGHVYFFKFNILDSGEYQVVETKRLEGSDSAEQFAFHIDHFGNKVVVTTRYGFELYDMESGSPELESTFNALEFAPEAWDNNRATIDVTDCEMNADYILCGIATDTIIREGEKFPPTYIADPWLTLHKWNEATQTYEYEMNILYRDIFPNGDHWHDMNRVHVGVDKETNLFIAGFPSSGYEQFPLFDENGNLQYYDDGNDGYAYRFDEIYFDGGRVAIINVDEDAEKGYTYEEIVVPLQEDTEDGFGFTGSCSSGNCLICSDDLEQPRCYIVEQDDSGNWVVEKRLEKQLDPSNQSIGDSFGFEAVLRNGTAVITDSQFVNIYEDISEVNTQAPEVLEPEGSSALCFARGSNVLVEGEVPGEVAESKIENVSIGDRIGSVDESGNFALSEVFLVQHMSDMTEYVVRQITYEDRSGLSRTLVVSPGHLLVSGRTERGLSYTTASTVTAGTIVFVADGKGDMVDVLVTDVKKSKSRVVNLHTMSDHIVVEGVVASCFAEVPLLRGVPFWERIMSVLIVPVKVLHRMGLRKLGQRMDVSANMISAHLSRLLKA